MGAGVHNEMSGSVQGGVVQAGAVHGDIHLHSDSATVPVPRQLLPAPAHFTDRASDLAELDAMWKEGEEFLPSSKSFAKFSSSTSGTRRRSFFRR